MVLMFNFQIWSNKEQRHVGRHIGEVVIDKEDEERLKALYEVYMSIKYPKCGYKPNDVTNRHQDCDECNGGKPMLEWSHGKSPEKEYFTKKYISQISSFSDLIDISVLFQSYQIHLKNG